MPRLSAQRPEKDRVLRLKFASESDCHAPVETISERDLANMVGSKVGYVSGRQDGPDRWEVELVQYQPPKGVNLFEFDLTP